MQVLGKVPEISGADPMVRFWRVPVQIPGEISEGFNADSR